MSGPWEKFQKPGAAPAAAAPWERFRKSEPVPGVASGTTLLEQGTSGLNEGIADFAGLPVDAVTGLLNMGARGLGLPQIERPFAGSESLRSLLSPFISDAEPETTGQRLARRVGQDVGAGAVAGPLAGVASLGGAALNTAASAAGGLSGGLAAEMTDNPTVQMIASILGGAGAVRGAQAMRPGARAPSLDDLRAVQGDAYATVEASPARLTGVASDDLKAALNQRMAAENIDPYLHPKASRTLERFGELDQPTIHQIEQRRRLVGRDVAGALDPSERYLGQAMKDEIDTYLARLQPGQVQSNSPVDEVIEALGTGRQMTQRIKKSEMVDNAIYRAENRAATSGTGGNEINATRQNIRAILDDPRKRRGFSPDEIKAMEGIVRGGTGTNTARMLGGLSPDRGALPLMGNIAGAAASGAANNPLFLVPGVVGAIAKQVGESLTKAQVNRLSEMIRYGGPIPTKTMTDAEQRVLSAILGSQAATGE